jgi:hypothetical protein
MQPLKKGCIKNLVAVTSPNFDAALEDLHIRQMALRTPPGGSQEPQHQGGPGRKCRPRDGSSNDCIARGVHFLCGQESRPQVGSRNGLGDGGACLLQKGIPGHLGDI